MTNLDNLALWQHGEGGWKWVHKGGEYGQTCRTDSTGQGLFVLKIAPNGQESWEQLKGTCQYQLPSDKKRAVWKLGQKNIATKDELFTLSGNF